MSIFSFLLKSQVEAWGGEAEGGYMERNATMHGLSCSPGSSPGYLLGWKVVLRTAEDSGVSQPSQEFWISTGVQVEGVWPQLLRPAAQRLAQQAQEQSTDLGQRVGVGGAISG